MLCAVLRLLQSYDQLDIVNAAGAEYVVRRLKQLEAATKRNPRQPDFEGLEAVLETSIYGTGGLLLP
eukprot:8575873-Lingulodinium_polyedra.AAC.1